MVNSAARKLEKERIDKGDFPKDDISWSSVSHHQNTQSLSLPHTCQE